MNIRLLRKVRKLYNSPFVSHKTNRSNQRKWVASVRRLGDKWLHATHIQRKGDTPAHRFDWCGAVGWPEKLPEKD